MIFVAKVVQSVIRKDKDKAISRFRCHSLIIKCNLLACSWTAVGTISFQNDLVTSTFYQFGYHHRFCQVIRTMILRGVVFTRNQFLYAGYMNLTRFNCSQESIDNLRTEAIRRQIPVEHIQSKLHENLSKIFISSFKYWLSKPVGDF